MSTPQIVSNDAWAAAQARLLEQEKALTRAADALAAERRRMPATEVAAGHSFAGPSGEATLLDLFEGRRQLALYSFMLEPGGAPCGGCSLFADQVAHLAHLHARGTTLALVSPAPLDEIEAVRARMGWTIPWYSLDGNGAFYDEIGVGTGFAFNVFLEEGGRVLRSYTTSGRGVEALGTTWSFLDRTPMGRQETWEDSPAWVPQDPPYTWARLHDEYEAVPTAG